MSPSKFTFRAWHGSNTGRTTINEGMSMSSITTAVPETAAVSAANGLAGWSRLAVMCVDHGQGRHG